MSRFDDYDYDYDEGFSNQGELWHANAQRALKGKKGRKALAELREALLALPEKRLISGALCTVDAEDRVRQRHEFGRGDLAEHVKREGEGVCAIGAYVWYRKVKAGADPQAAFAGLPTMLDSDGGMDYETANAGQRAGLTFVLAWTLAQKNDSEYELGNLSPEDRYEAFMAWLDTELAGAA